VIVCCGRFAGFAKPAPFVSSRQPLYVSAASEPEQCCRGRNRWRQHIQAALISSIHHTVSMRRLSGGCIADTTAIGKERRAAVKKWPSTHAHILSSLVHDRPPPPFPCCSPPPKDCKAALSDSDLEQLSVYDKDIFVDGTWTTTPRRSPFG